MKKAFIAALCLILVGLLMVNGTFALPSLQSVFQWIQDLGESAAPAPGGQGSAVHVQLRSDDTPKNLYPGGQVSRSFQVKNLGQSDVFFRLVYAVQYDAATWDKLDVCFDADSGFLAHDWQDIRIGSTAYKMKVFSYDTSLTAGAVSPGVGISIAMDSSMTSEQVSNYRSDFLQTQVLAIEAAPFVEKGYDAAQALELALPLDELNPF